MFDLDPRVTGLPPAAADKLRSLQDANDALRAFAWATGDKREAAAEELRHFDLQVQIVREAGRKAEPKDLEAALAAQASAKAELVRRRERAAAVGQDAQAAGACLANISAWLHRLMGTVEFAPFSGPVPSPLRRGEAIPAAVDRVRGEIAQAKADLHRIASAPLHSVEAKAAVRRQVEAMAEAGAPDVGPVLEGEPIRWPTFIQRSNSNEVVVTGAPDTRALLAWLFKGPLLTRLEAEIDAASDDRIALSSVQRRAEDARVRASLLALERAEEELIASAPEGVRLWRRADADPRAVLGLADTVPGYER